MNIKHAFNLTFMSLMLATTCFAYTPFYTWFPCDGMTTDIIQINNKFQNIVIDKKNHLMWAPIEFNFEETFKPGPDGTFQEYGNFFTYKQAQKLVKLYNKKNFLDYNDWRLPTADDYNTLITRARENGIHAENPEFSTFYSKCGFAMKENYTHLWSSTLVAGYEDFYQVMGFNLGYLIPGVRKFNLDLLEELNSGKHKYSVILIRDNK